MQRGKWGLGVKENNDNSKKKKNRKKASRNWQQGSAGRFCGEFMCESGTTGIRAAPRLPQS